MALIYLKWAQEALCVSAALPFLLECREEKKRVFLVLVAGWILMSLATTYLTVSHTAWGDTVELVRILKLSGLCCFLLIGGMTVYGGPVKLLLVILIQDLQISATTILCDALFFWVVGAVLRKNADDPALAYHPLKTLLNVLVYLVVIWLLRPLYRRFREFSPRLHPAVQIGISVFFLLYGFSSAYFLVGITALNHPASGGKRILPIVSMAFFLLLLYYFVMAELRRIEARTIQLENQYMAEHLQSLKEQIVLARKLRHDIRRHRNVLKWTDTASLTPDQLRRREGYLQQLDRYEQQLAAGDYCDDPECNAILSHLERSCRERGIALEIRLKNLNVSELENASEVLTSAVDWVTQRMALRTGNGMDVQIDGIKAAGQSLLQVTVSGEPESRIDGNCERILQHMLRRTGEAVITGDNGVTRLRISLPSHPDGKTV